MSNETKILFATITVESEREFESKQEALDFQAASESLFQLLDNREFLILENFIYDHPELMAKISEGKFSATDIMSVVSAKPKTKRWKSLEE